MCGEMILTTAAKCRYCGEVFDATLKRAKAKKSGGKKAEMRKIATLQKYLVMCILFFILSYLAMIVTFATQPTQAGPPQPGASLSALALVLFLVIIVASLGSWVLSVMLAYKVYGTGGAILVFLLQFVPCANLITLLVVNSKATTMLKDKGYTVGFLGADLSEFR